MQTLPQYAELLERALAPGVTLDDVKAKLAENRAWFWPGERSAAVSEILDGRDFHIWLAAGDLRELLEIEQSAEIHARAIGCERMTLIGRRGWDRVLAKRGYAPMLVKELK